MAEQPPATDEAGRPDAGAAPRTPPRLRVRTGQNYHVPFVVDAGQRNAVFVRRPLTPLVRYVRAADAVAPLVDRGFDLVHSLNAVPVLTRRPYLVTFEDYLPRTPPDRRVAWLERALREMLVRPRCVAVVAMSQYAVRRLRLQHQGWAGLSELERKLVQLYPAIAERRSSPKQRSRTLRLLFVGKHFIRKGGPALVRAHAALRRAGVPVEVTVVSSLHWRPRDHVVPPSVEWVERQHRALAESGVEHHLRLPNRDVMTLLEGADFLVLPTLHDSFGYVVLEALATATPVVATATCALPEIVQDGVSGYLLQLDNDESGRWRMLDRKYDAGYAESYDDALDRLAEQLVERLASAYEDRAGYEALSAGALARARERFSRRRLRDRLEELYEQCRRP